MQLSLVLYYGFPLRPRPVLRILLQRNRAGFCSPPGSCSDKMARILAKWLRAVILQLFAAAGVDTRDYQLAQKHVRT